MRALAVAGVLIAALAAASSALAQTPDHFFYVTPFGGYTVFDDNLRIPNDVRVKDRIYLGGRVGYQWNRWFGLEAAGGVTPSREDTTGGVHVRYMHLSGNLVFTPVQLPYVTPFVFAGYGWNRLKPEFGGKELKEGALEAGGGLRVHLTDQVGLRLEARNLSMLQKGPIKITFNNTVVGAGIDLMFGRVWVDSDADGVPDKDDQCPNTPKGCIVDSKGCPIDSDGDGVCDGLDQCPNTPKGCIVDARGCPTDSDGDGVCDGLDQCPNTPKGCLVDQKGCPIDSDGDGVCDGIDQCPNTPKGCIVDQKGCPIDSDGDGVCDGLDKCPNTPKGAKVDKDGCPQTVSARETELIDTGMIRLQNINFATGKADLLPESMPILDDVGAVLSKWPQLKIEIGGHTDARGSATLNQKLSEARAKSVLDYLLQKFPNLKAEQFTTKGYGKSKPIAPNDTEVNMAKNRRVEFVVLNKEILKKN